MNFPQKHIINNNLNFKLTINILFKYLLDDTSNFILTTLCSYVFIYSLVI
jgi:hypothetical protein